MNLFQIDTVGEKSLLNEGRNKNVKKNNFFESKSPTENAENRDHRTIDKNNDENSENEYDYFGIPPPSFDIFDILRNPSLYNKPLYGEETIDTTVPSDLDIFCRAMSWINLDGVLPKKHNAKPKQRWEIEEIDLNDVHEDLTKTDFKKEMKNSTLKGIEKKREIKILREREALRERKAEASKTKGKNWYNMPATEITDELRQNMEIIQMRSVLNPIHFYKKNDMKTLPKYFQVGTVLPSPLERYKEPGVSISKKRSLVDELLDDAEFQQYNKRRYNEVMAEKKRTGFKKAYKKNKKLKKKS